MNGNQLGEGGSKIGTSWAGKIGIRKKNQRRKKALSEKFSPMGSVIKGRGKVRKAKPETKKLVGEKEGGRDSRWELCFKG